MPPRPAPTPRRISRSASAATATLQERVDELEATVESLGLERDEAVQQAAEYEERAVQWEAYATAAERSSADRDAALRRLVSTDGDDAETVDPEADALEDVQRLVYRLRSSLAFTLRLRMIFSTKGHPTISMPTPTHRSVPFS